MGSRWMWEAANWQYPKMPDGKIQKDEPDDASADGADMMDDNRYLIVSFFPADALKPEKKNPTRAERLKKEAPVQADELPRGHAPNVRSRVPRLSRLQAPHVLLRPLHHRA
jgi:hypothetical protein